MLQIRCKNNNVTKSFPEGTSLVDVYQEFAPELNMTYPVVSAKVNNASQGLKFRLYQNRDVEFIDARDGSGRRVYVRSLCFVLYKASCDIFPGSKLFIEHPCRAATTVTSRNVATNRLAMTMLSASVSECRRL